MRSYSPAPLAAMMPAGRNRLAVGCAFLFGIVVGFVLFAFLGGVAVHVRYPDSPPAPPSNRPRPPSTIAPLPAQVSAAVARTQPRPFLSSPVAMPAAVSAKDGSSTKPRAPFSCYELPPLPDTPLYSAEEAAKFLADPPFPYDQLKCLAPQLDSDGQLMVRKPGMELLNYRRSPQTVAWMQQLVDYVGGTTCTGDRVLVDSRQSQSYSQQYEDMAIFSAMYASGAGHARACPGGGVNDKVVVELGAVDGKDMSNSFFFERGLGWRSLLIEANPDNYARLLGHRPGPRAVKVNRVICQPGESRSFAKARAAGSGGIVQSLDPMKVAKYGVDVEHSVDIPCTDFQALYRQHNITAVELFSLDVEGAEELVLRHMDWSVPVRFLLVEMDAGLMYTTPDNKAYRCRELLAGKGYFPAVWGRMGENVLFVRSRADALPMP